MQISWLRMVCACPGCDGVEIRVTVLVTWMGTCLGITINMNDGDMVWIDGVIISSCSFIFEWRIKARLFWFTQRNADIRCR